MQAKLLPEERLIVAADFRPPKEDVWLENGSYPGENIMCSSKIDWVHRQVIQLAEKLRGTGVYLKVNSALRACGYKLISEINSLGLRVFADLKLNDIPNTLTDDGVLLRQTKPGLAS
jgi:orotidine-5'-phosphate decarboxylase